MNAIPTIVLCCQIHTYLPASFPTTKVKCNRQYNNNSCDYTNQATNDQTRSKENVPRAIGLFHISQQVTGTHFSTS